jgi:hypothetical protein
MPSKKKFFDDFRGSGGRSRGRGCKVVFRRFEPVVDESEGREGFALLDLALKSSLSVVVPFG